MEVLESSRAENLCSNLSLYIAVFQYQARFQDLRVQRESIGHYRVSLPMCQNESPPTGSFSFKSNSCSYKTRFETEAQGKSK